MVIGIWYAGTLVRSFFYMRAGARAPDPSLPIAKHSVPAYQRTSNTLIY